MTNRSRELLAVFVFVVLCIAFAFAAIEFLNLAAELVTALVTACATLLIAVFKYSSDRLKEQEIETRRLRQNHYKELMRAIGKFAANNDDYDALQLAYSESWAYASPKVVHQIHEFIKNPKKNVLAHLLITIRQDLDFIPFHKPNVFAGIDLNHMESLVSSLYAKKPSNQGLSS